ncbi:unnamed protein product [Prorocentrum cordatum]|uniref:Calcineurin-like phosphoesterase domain-containing protein n=1 Tax=Prorocentrum cordatum TaxID=2364126 RepID=A0ABN9T545_9DINO|nr:unnamed protein product [Polarella glacialis]
MIDAMAWIDFDDLDDIPTVHAVSDPHCEAPANMDWLRGLPACPLLGARQAGRRPTGQRRSTDTNNPIPARSVRVAGGVGRSRISRWSGACAPAREDPRLRAPGLPYRCCCRGFGGGHLPDRAGAPSAPEQVQARVLYDCFGNHECWVSKNGPYADSFAKIGAIRELCRSMGVRTDAALVDGVWIVPVFGWYHNSWDTEPDLEAPPGERLRREPDSAADMSNDYVLCKWGDLENGSEALAERIDSENEEWGSWPLPPELVADAKEAPGKRRRPILSFSHFLPRIELHPEKRFSMQPNLAKLIGSNWIRARVEQLRPDVHIFGHTHYCWDMRLDGTRYRSWPLGMPMERLYRAMSFPGSSSEVMLPLPVLNACGEQAPEHDHCFASRMYSFLDRDPSSYVMSHRVAAKYCPSAPVLFDDVVMPGRRYLWDFVDDQIERDRMVRACTQLNQTNKRRRRALREWEVVGGAGSGGVAVREDGPFAPLLPERLATGALVEELQLKEGHVCFSNCHRTVWRGPQEGLGARILGRRAVDAAAAGPPRARRAHGAQGDGPAGAAGVPPGGPQGPGQDEGAAPEPPWQDARPRPLRARAPGSATEGVRRGPDQVRFSERQPDAARRGYPTIFECGHR